MFIDHHPESQPTATSVAIVNFVMFSSWLTQLSTSKEELNNLTNTIIFNKSIRQITDLYLYLCFLIVVI